VVFEVASDGGAVVFRTKLLTFVGTMNGILSSMKTMSSEWIEKITDASHTSLRVRNANFSNHVHK